MNLKYGFIVVDKHSAQFQIIYRDLDAGQGNANVHFVFISKQLDMFPQ